MAIDKQTLFSVKLNLFVFCVGIITSAKAQGWVIDDKGCRIPNRGVGVCMSIKQCKPMTDFIKQYSPLSQNAIELLQSYQCGFEGNSVKVCCPDNPIILQPSILTPIIPSVEECRTPNKDVGICMLVKNCKPILDFIQQSLPLTQNTIEIVQGYQCGNEGNSIKVCCPDSPIVKPTIPFVPAHLENGCKTPNEDVGVCIPIKQCKPMLDFIQQQQQQQSLPLSQNAVKLIQEFQCEIDGNSVKVCCPEDPITLAPSVPKPEIPTITIPSAPDITNHKNLNLLPNYDCGVQSLAKRITGGTKTSLFEFPWMALLSYDIGGGVDFRCGGTVINERYILTAAHCITNLASLKLIGVRLGEYNISSPLDCEQEPFGEEYCAPPVQDILVAESIPHPKYNRTTITDDIGLIRLVNPINISVESVSPICLPVTEEFRNNKFNNTKLTVTGWGATETGQRSKDLLKVDILPTTKENCQKAYVKSNVKINYKQICAGGNNKSDSCRGDSGGPLQKPEEYNGDIRYIQYGVVSFGPRDCGQEGFPGVYTRVDYYMDWILDNLEPS